MRTLVSWIRAYPFESLAVAAWMLCSVIFLFHDLSRNPQADLQLMTDMFALAQASLDGTIGEFLLTVRKYPLLPGMLLAGPTALLFAGLRMLGIVADFDGGLRAYLFTDPWQLHLLLRTLFLCAAMGTMAAAAAVASRLWNGSRIRPLTAALLGGSVLWAMYATAIRPHVLVAGAVTLCCLVSMRHLRSPTMRMRAASFLTATLAFCMLQNGLLAFIFPIWATLRGDGWKRGTFFSSLWLTLSGLASAALGYPFVLRPLLGMGSGFGLELGHNQTTADTRWGLHGLRVIAEMFATSEWLFLFALLACIVALARRKLVLREEHWMIVVFLGAYYGVFGVYSSPHPRYFVATFPLLAALTSGGFAAVPSRIRAALCTVAAGVIVLFGYRALQPNTYQLAEAFLQEHPGTVGTDLPAHILGLLPTKASIGTPRMERERWIAGLESDLAGAREVVPFVDDRAVVRIALWGVTDDATWNTCGTFGTTSGGPGMLWAEIERPIAWLLRTRNLGPLLTAQCRVTR